MKDTQWRVTKAVSLWLRPSIPASSAEHKAEEEEAQREANAELALLQKTRLGLSKRCDESSPGMSPHACRAHVSHLPTRV